jgi:hypothetical protein
VPSRIGTSQAIALPVEAAIPFVFSGFWIDPDNLAPNHVIGVSGEIEIASMVPRNCPSCKGLRESCNSRRRRSPAARLIRT